MMAYLEVDDDDDDDDRRHLQHMDSLPQLSLLNVN
jgi:hypothetical protein